MLALPGLLVLLGGLPALLRTGQVDPRGWMLPALLLIPAATWLNVRRGEGVAIWASVGTVGVVLSCAFLASWHVPGLVPAAWLLGVVLAATLAGIGLAGIRASAKVGARPLVGAGLALLALAGCWLAKEPRIESLPGARPELAVITGLPLFWREGGEGLAAKADAPILTVLRQRFTVLPVDSPLALGKGRAKLLLLAQPRAFSMDELVALDAWISHGGRALILADPQLRWPMDLPLGDRRRPPAVAQLTALLEHWGASLVPLATDGEQRHFLGDGRMLTVYAASSFGRAGPDCRIAGRGLIARCAVGKGMATILADADLIDDRLWLADPAAPLDPGQWTADTPQFMAEALGGELPDGRRWVRSGTALVSAVRWAVLIGIFWAALGAVLLSRRGGPRFDRSLSAFDGINPVQER